MAENAKLPSTPAINAPGTPAAAAKPAPTGNPAFRALGG